VVVSSTSYMRVPYSLFNEILSLEVEI